jgi:glycosyltransferase involved in cell wall biosynthesis
MRFLYQRAARIILFSRDSSDLLEKAGGDVKKVVWVPHGVDLTLTPEPRPAPRDQVFTVKYIGAHNQWNNLGPIIDAAKYLQDKGVGGIDFRFIGDGVLKPSLEARVKHERIHNVHFEQPVPKNRIADVLHSADAFILNNNIDGVSKRWMSFNKLYEYLAARRPVVFGSCTAVNPVQESGAGVLVEAGNHVQIAEAVAMLARMSPEQLDAYGQRGRMHIEKHYSIAAIVDRFETMARQLTGHRTAYVSKDIVADQEVRQGK